MRPNKTPEYVSRKKGEAKLAQEMLNNVDNPMTLRQVAEELGYNHPQSIVLLIKNYGEKENGNGNV